MPKTDPPSRQDLQTLLGSALPLWEKLEKTVEDRYDMEIVWHTAGKAAPYEKKYCRGGKTLCSLFPKEGAAGFMVVLGRAEQEKFEAASAEFSPEIVAAYNATKVYHDGRWMLLWMTDAIPMEDIERLLLIKRRPNKKIKNTIRIKDNKNTK